jgi:hypothetical protein
MLELWRAEASAPRLWRLRHYDGREVVAATDEVELEDDAA